MVPEQVHLIILDDKSDIWISKNSKDIKHTIHIYRIMHFVRNCEKSKLQNTVWCEGGLHLADRGTDNVRENLLNTRLGYSMVRLHNCHNTCHIGVTEYRIVWRTMCSGLLDCTKLIHWLNEFEVFIWV